MMTSDFIRWLAAQEYGGKTYNFYPGPEGPTTDPKPYGVVTSIPGGRFTTEGKLELLLYQVKIVGPQGTTGQSLLDQAEAAERLARDVDRAILTADSPIIGLSRVVYTDRLGGAPYAHPRESGKRFNFTCVYQIEAESEI